jgi:abhydrolase domain-containing protein 14
MISEKHVDAGNTAVHYLEAGAEGGQVILLLHGKNFHSGTWMETGTIDVLVGNGFHAFAVDLPGFGKSPESDVGKPETLTAIIKALGLDSPVIISPSMSGGYSLPVIAEGAVALKGYVAVAPTNIADYANSLKGNPLPVLAIWGSDDQVVPPENADLLCNALPNADKVIIENGGHPTYLNQTDIFHSYLIGFLRGL